MPLTNTPSALDRMPVPHTPSSPGQHTREQMPAPVPSRKQASDAAQSDSAAQTAPSVKVPVDSTHSANRARSTQTPDAPQRSSCRGSQFTMSHRPDPASLGNGDPSRLESASDARA